MGYVYQLVAAPLFLVAGLFLLNSLLALSQPSGDLIDIYAGVFALPIFLIAVKLLRDGRKKIRA